MRRLNHYLLFAVLWAMTCLPNLGAPSLWDIDEGNNAACGLRDAPERQLDRADVQLPPPRGQAGPHLLAPDGLLPHARRQRDGSPASLGAGGPVHHRRRLRTRAADVRRGHGTSRGPHPRCGRSACSGRPISPTPTRCSSPSAPSRWPLSGPTSRANASERWPGSASPAASPSSPRGRLVPSPRPASAWPTSPGSVSCRACSTGVWAISPRLRPRRRALVRLGRRRNERSLDSRVLEQAPRRPRDDRDGEPLRAALLLPPRPVRRPAALVDLPRPDGPPHLEAIAPARRAGPCGGALPRRLGRGVSGFLQHRPGRNSPTTSCPPTQRSRF